jgi:hypothetical protein
MGTKPTTGSSRCGWARAGARRRVGRRIWIDRWMIGLCDVEPGLGWPRHRDWQSPQASEGSGPTAAGATGPGQVYIARRLKFCQRWMEVVNESCYKGLASSCAVNNVLGPGFFDKIVFHNFPVFFLITSYRSNLLVEILGSALHSCSSRGYTPSCRPDHQSIFCPLL